MNSANRNWFRVALPAPSAKKGERLTEVIIYDEIGFFGITAKEFRTEFLAAARVSDKIRIRINSLGGSVFDALAMYHTIKGIQLPVEVVIDGVAASAASFIAMAGDPVIMPANAFIMVHLPSWVSIGTADKMRKDAEALDMFAQSMVNIYATKTNLEEAEILRLLTDETWLSADEAVRLGFADTISDSVKIAARAEFSRYAHAPESLTLAATTPPEPKGNLPMADDPKPAAATPPGKTEAEIRAEVLAAQAAATRDIVALCKLAGKADLAASFIMANASVDDVKAALLKLVDEEEAADVSAILPKKPADPALKTASATLAPNLSPEKVYARWNKRRPASASATA